MAGIKLTTMDDVFAEAGIAVSGLNLINDKNDSYLRILGVAEATRGRVGGLDSDDEVWAIGVVLKDADGKVVGADDNAVALHKSPMASFKIAVWPLCDNRDDIVEAQLYPFVCKRSRW